ncbi:MAG TPA: DUF308 domain-containing protein [Gammaproteobacteria bacterium]|nr:DUF308 domain-containing protein [Gammaproteobacteria bacterium]
MNLSVQLNQSRGWLFAYGILLIILGIIAISVAALTTLISVVFLGILLLLGGIFALYDTFKSWRHKPGSFILHLILALLFIAAGIMLIEKPILGAISLTLLLAVFYIVVGIFRIITALSLNIAFKGWHIVSGIIALVLGILILAHLPASSLLIIGLFIGIDLIFSGLGYFLLALANKNRGLAA